MTSTAVLGKSCMLYAALGDAIGYKNGEWEFNKSTEDILAQASRMGGIQHIRVNVRQWPVSDDTVMHLATAIAIAQSFHPSPSVRSALYNVLRNDRFWNFALKAKECARILRNVALGRGDFGSSGSKKLIEGFKRFTPAIIDWYVSCMSIMEGRAPGRQTLEAVDEFLSQGKLPDRFNARAGGNGAAMRTMCIGLLSNISPIHLVHLSMVAGVATHPNVTALMGGCLSAALTHMADGVRIHPAKWLPLFYRYYYDHAQTWLEYRFRNEWSQMKQAGDVDYFDEHVNAYYNARFDEHGQPVFPSDWLHNSAKRDEFYKSLAYQGASGSTWNGSSGHDAVLIAYDCFLFSPYDWHTVAYLAAFHGGDSDSTGSIAGAFFGAFNGMRTKTMVGLEFADVLAVLGTTIATL